MRAPSGDEVSSKADQSGALAHHGAAEAGRGVRIMAAAVVSDP